MGLLIIKSLEPIHWSLKIKEEFNDLQGFKHLNWNLLTVPSILR